MESQPPPPNIHLQCIKEEAPPTFQCTKTMYQEGRSPLSQHSMTMYHLNPERSYQHERTLPEKGSALPVKLSYAEIFQHAGN